MRGGIVPTHQESVYQKGYRAGRDFGRIETRLEDGHLLPMGISIGVVIGAVLEPIVRWWFS